MLAADLSERDATLAFVCSRMRVIDPHERRGRVRLRHLAFQDWLEALCRVAALKALPTGDEIAAAGTGNAGTHLLQLARESPPDYEAMLCERATRWGQLPSLQPLARCVEHLCHMIIVHCQGGLRRPPSAPLVGASVTRKDVRSGFAKRK